MTKQPEALRLAEILERPGYGWNSTPKQCATELRRLHEENQELLEALKELKAVMSMFPKIGNVIVGYKDRYNAAQFKARAAIAKATGEQQ